MAQVDRSRATADQLDRRYRVASSLPVKPAFRTERAQGIFGMMFGGPTKPGKLSLFGVWRKVTLGKLLESNPGVPPPELMMMAHDPAAWEVRGTALQRGPDAPPERVVSNLAGEILTVEKPQLSARGLAL